MYLSKVDLSTNKLMVLLNELLDVSKINLGKLDLTKSEININEYLPEVLSSIQHITKDHTIVLEQNAAAKSAIDPIRLEQVITNLVSNAHKYTPEGGQILLGAEATNNQWDPEGAKRVVHLWVKDNGIGINIEDQNKIFQKFFRSDDMKAREVPGTGLGLNITKSLVEMQGGRIWFDSEFRKGTTFHFTIPVAEG